MSATRLGAMLLAVLLLAPAQPAVAQQARDVERRVTTLESQMRAVQRRVFPGGDSRFFAPDPEPAPEAPAGPPPPNPMLELTERLQALESQQRLLTGQVEELQFRVRQLEGQLEKVRGDTDFRLNELEGRTGGRPAPADTGVLAPPPAPAPGTAAPPARPPAQAAPAPAAADPEQAYLAAYGLYTAGDYPAAVTALEAFVKAHPRHPRASNAQFWAGRAQMAQGNHAEAARAFLSGYQTYPRGERAHNSLLWLGRALLAMRQPQAACQALDQLRTAFPDRVTGGFAAEVQRTRTEARCPA